MEYNNSYHSGIKTTPMDRYLSSKGKIKEASSSEWLDEVFLNRISRKVKFDSTVSIENISFDVPMQFISSTVEIRYSDEDFSDAFILYNSKKYPIRKTNKVDNAKTKRKSYPIDYSSIE